MDAQVFNFNHQKPSKRILEIKELWDSIRGDKAMPSRRDFHPMSVPHLLPYIYMDNVSYDPLGFQIRLVGTAISRNLGYDATGETRDPKKSQANIWERLIQVSEEKKPILHLNVHFYEHENNLPNYDCVHLPFSDDGETVNIILSLSSLQKQNDSFVLRGSKDRLTSHR